MAAEPDLCQPDVDLKASPFNLKALKQTEKAMSGNVSTEVRLKSMTELQLLLMRQEIDLLLPTKFLADLNMEEELMAQYMLAKHLQNNVHQDSEKGVTDKEKGQLLRMATTTLESLIKLQNSTYTSERIKHVEVALALAFEETPLEVRQAFYTKYEAMISEKGAKKKI